MPAIQVPVPWRLALGSLAVLAVSYAGQVGTCEHRSPPIAATPAVEQTHVHVKLKRGGHVRAFASVPMFSSLPPADDDRARWVRVPVARRDAPAVAAELARDPAVEQAFVAPEVTLPRSLEITTAPDEGPSCPITTPSFESYQGYLGSAPHGIDAPAAWRRGHRGAGVWFADVEGGWNAEHEDLPGERIEHVAGVPIRDPSWRAHGTAVLGQVVGRDNGKGVVGIAPDVERVFTASIDGVSVADAIDTAANRLRPGDVLLIELQMGPGPRNRWIPVEYWDDVFDAIRAATRRGVIVIEAAGNGYEDLDHRAYGKKFDRARRDSGAIMVGAGAPPRPGFSDRARLDFSNHGTRVYVQGGAASRRSTTAISRPARARRPGTPTATTPASSPVPPARPRSSRARPCCSRGSPARVGGPSCPRSCATCCAARARRKPVIRPNRSARVRTWRGRSGPCRSLLLPTSGDNIVREGGRFLLP